MGEQESNPNKSLPRNGFSQLSSLDNKEHIQKFPRNWKKQSRKRSRGYLAHHFAQGRIISIYTILTYACLFLKDFSDEETTGSPAVYYRA